MSDNDPNELVRGVEADDHSQGSPDAAVTLVEYGDFQCSFCGAAHPVVQAVQKQMGDDLRFVFRNFPLTQIHEHAQKAAEAAESAGAQGKYWESHDLLFERQDALDRDDLIGYAKELGLDQARFAHDVDSDAFSGKIRSDFSGGVASGVNGTPSFFINGVRYDGPADVDAMLEAIRAVMS